jgi:carboxymethylenebutenolidase
MDLFGHAVRHTTEKFATDGHSITLERFLPETGASVPAIIGLHGSGGIHGGFIEPARLLAANGFAVFVPHYFERTGTVWADERTIRREFPSWMAAVRDTVAFAETQPGVARGGVGLLGFSLGAYLALSVASLDDRIGAVVDYFGGLPEEFASGLQRMPPVLILHGQEDSVVPVAEAAKLEAVLKPLNVPYEKKIYPGAGHAFSGMALIDAAQRTLAFLRKHLH